MTGAVHNHAFLLSVPQVYGPTAINVHQLLDQLREQGELFLIGAEVRADRTKPVLCCTGWQPGAPACACDRPCLLSSAVCCTRYCLLLLPDCPAAAATQVSLLEGRDERMAEGSGGSLAGQPSSPRHRAKLPQPAAEIHLQARCVYEAS